MLVEQDAHLGVVDLDDGHLTLDSDGERVGVLSDLDERGL